MNRPIDREAATTTGCPPNDVCNAAPVPCVGTKRSHSLAGVAWFGSRNAVGDEPVGPIAKWFTASPCEHRSFLAYGGGERDRYCFLLLCSVCLFFCSCSGVGGRLRFSCLGFLSFLFPFSSLLVITYCSVRKVARPHRESLPVRHDWSYTDVDMVGKKLTQDEKRRATHPPYRSLSSVCITDWQLAARRADLLDGWMNGRMG